jgi:hypothetical protein
MPVYEPSNKHCEPITAEKPGTKCPAWSVSMAQQLLDSSIAVSPKLRYATHGGLAFVGRITNSGQDIWHGYPEAWDDVPREIKEQWLSRNLITKADIKRHKTRKRLDEAMRDEP